MRKIAVVEDNADNRMLVQALLCDRYEVAEYETGREAIEGFNNERPDLILLDISLPEMNGSEVLAHLRADPELRSIPVIALTAHAMTGDREAFLGQGFDGYVSKPIVDEKALFESIEALLGTTP
ncbi:MAG: response regulator [Proteobacteria bacterium]|nr:response regulator [Pseudomonadota bacterium]